MKSSKYFTENELKCKETGECDMNPMFLEMLDMLREELGRPVYLTSAYRSPKHSIEAKKKEPGTHAQGIAADISCTNGADRYRILDAAYKLGFTGVGVHPSFIHLDIRKTTPVVWNY